MEFLKWVDSSLVFVFQVGWFEIVTRPVGDPLGNLFRNIAENPTEYLPSAGTVKDVIFIIVGTWLFSFLLWDFILSMFKQFELMRKSELNVFNFKRETQCFVITCVLIGWGLYFLSKWFENPDWGAWLVGVALLGVAALFNRDLEKTWMVTAWEPIERENGERLQGEEN